MTNKEAIYMITDCYKYLQNLSSSNEAYVKKYVLLERDMFDTLEKYCYTTEPLTKNEDYKKCKNIVNMTRHIVQEDIMRKGASKQVQYKNILTSIDDLITKLFNNRFKKEGKDGE